jgi:hypothetical protein
MSLSSAIVISLGVQSLVPSSSLPATSWSRRTVSRRLFGLAPAGVYHAARVTTSAVGSYPTFSPLPPDKSNLPEGGLFSVARAVTLSKILGAPAILETCPGVTWQPVHGARTFLGNNTTLPRPSSQLQHKYMESTIKSL